MNPILSTKNGDFAMKRRSFIQLSHFFDNVPSHNKTPENRLKVIFNAALPYVICS